MIFGQVLTEGWLTGNGAGKTQPCMQMGEHEFEWVPVTSRSGGGTRSGGGGVQDRHTAAVEQRARSQWFGSLWYTRFSSPHAMHSHCGALRRRDCAQLKDSSAPPCGHSVERSKIHLSGMTS